MTDPIAPALARELDAFTVPPLPPGFADRVAALATDEAAPALPRQRPRSARRWWRASGAGLGMVAMGMVSISAAAMGYFGEPVRTAVHRAPVIGKVVERIIPAPARKVRVVAKRPVVVPAAAADPAPPPPIAQAGPQGRAPLLRAIRQATPEQRRAWLEAHPAAAARIAERRADRLANPLPPEIRAERRARLREAAQARRLRDPLAVLPVEAPYAATPLTPRQRLERLRAFREQRQRALRQETQSPAEPEPQP